jgi:carboxyl-terminal processing protease
MRYLILFFLIVGPLFSDSLSPEEQIQYQSNKFKYILETAYKNHKDTFDISKVSDKAFDALLKAIDKNSGYYDKPTYTALSQSQTGKQYGIGASVTNVNDTATVAYVIPGSPADSAGIEISDRVLFIDGKNTSGLSYKELNELLEGDHHSEVSLIVQKGWKSDLKQLVLPRKDTDVPGVPASFIIAGTNIAYIKINKFSDNTDEVAKSKIEELMSQSPKGFVLDLRDNPGGRVESAANIGAEFLSKGDTILIVKSNNTEIAKTYICEKDGIASKIPLIVLINKQSASASEILAGAIQDNERGKVIGEISFGKATIQNTWRLTDSTAFKITVAEYLTPSGRSLHIDNKEEAELDPALKLSLGEEEFEKLQKMINSTPNTRMPIYYTKSGKSIVGGMGILPDIIEKKDTLTLLTNVLIQKRLFHEYIYSFIYRFGEQQKETYGKDFRLFEKDAYINDNILNDFSVFCRRHNIANEAMFEQDKEYIRNYLKAILAHSLWGDEAYVFIDLKLDSVAQKAVAFLEQN